MKKKRILAAVLATLMVSTMTLSAELPLRRKTA